MQIINVITALGLATAASAIDIRLSAGETCGGTTLQCGRINPNTCCYASGNFRSVGWGFIPTDWNLEVVGFGGGGCTRNINSANLSGLPVTDFCLTRNPYTGGRYSFVNKKRGVERSSEECQSPDSLRLPDGTTYSLKELEKDQIDLIVENLGNITTAANIPGGVERLARLA